MFVGESLVVVVFFFFEGVFKERSKIERVMKILIVFFFGLK